MELFATSAKHAVAFDRRLGSPAFRRCRRVCEKRLSELENLLDLVKLDPGANAALLAPLLDIPLPSERAVALPPEELRRRQLAALINLMIAGARAQPAVLTLEDL